MSRARKIKKASRRWRVRITLHDGSSMIFIEDREQWAKFTRIYEKAYDNHGRPPALWPGVIKYWQCRCCKPTPNPKPRRGKGMPR